MDGKTDERRTRSEELERRIAELFSSSDLEIAEQARIGISLLETKLTSDLEEQARLVARTESDHPLQLRRLFRMIDRRRTLIGRLSALLHAAELKGAG